jgi:hypothetical protein
LIACARRWLEPVAAEDALANQHVPEGNRRQSHYTTTADAVTQQGRQRGRGLSSNRVQTGPGLNVNVTQTGLHGLGPPAHPVDGHWLTLTSTRSETRGRRRTAGSWHRSPRVHKADWARPRPSSLQFYNLRSRASDTDSEACSPATVSSSRPAVAGLLPLGAAHPGVNQSACPEEHCARRSTASGKRGASGAGRESPIGWLSCPSPTRLCPFLCAAVVTTHHSRRWPDFTRAA